MLVIKVARGVASVRVEHTLKDVLGQEVRDEWRSEVGRQPGDTACGMCRADFGVEFWQQGKEVMVTVRVWRDLGAAAGEGGAGEMWEAAAGRRPVRRERGDFGQVKRAFEAPLDGSGMVRREEGIDRRDGVEPGVTKGGEVASEEELHMQVADGLQPPPPYTP
jgi:hypothetical protein